MGIFDFGKNLARRSEAADTIQQCLESLARNGAGKLPPFHRQLAADLVSAAWPAVTAMVGEGKAAPHRLSIAAFALARGITANRHDERMGCLLAAALGVLLKSIAADKGLLQLHEVDAALVDQARKAFLAFGDTLSEQREAPGVRRPRRES
jgi:hypothetical protein